MQIRNIFLILIGLLFSGCASVQSDWDSAQSIDNREAYLEFIEKYPNNVQYRPLALQRLETIEYEKASQLGTIEAHQKFIEEYPRGDLAQKAKAFIEKAIYEQAKEKNTISEFDKYLKEYPNGAYVSEVNKLRGKKAEESGWQKAKRINTIEGYQKFLGTYPHSEFISEANNKIAKIEEINNFERILRSTLTLSESEFEQFVSNLPAEDSDKIVPILELRIQRDIVKKGIGSRLVVSGIQTKTASRSSVTISDRGGFWSLDMEQLFDEIPQSNMQSILFGHRSVHRFSGEVKFANTKLPVFIGDGDKSNRLTFLLLKDTGYIYMRGRGRVVFPDGRTVELGNTLQ